MHLEAINFPTKSMMTSGIFKRNVKNRGWEEAKKRNSDPNRRVHIRRAIDTDASAKSFTASSSTAEMRVVNIIPKATCFVWHANP